MAILWKTVEQLGPGIGPYAHWWEDKEKPFIPDGVIDRTSNTEINLRLPGNPKGRTSRATADAFYSGGASVPLPLWSGNPNRPKTWSTAKTSGKLTEVPDDTVLVGIVDTGISLSNARFRMEDGRTRFIASWQQSAPFRGQTDLPCGHELYQGDIQAKLDQYGPPGRLDCIDEIAFNRDLCLTEPTKPGAQRDLEMAAAHGTHVLDLAAGLDPCGDMKDLADRLRLISVNLPAQYAHGTAGAFLPYFAVYAVDRILHLADALWERNNPGQAGGYPLVINFSYGMMAGPKDGSHIFESALKEILSQRSSSFASRGVKSPPVRLIMPAGNDNLSRGAASIVLGKEGHEHDFSGKAARETITLPWRIKPGDATANFLEIWTDASPKKVLDQVRQKMKISITPPGSDTLWLRPLEFNTYQDLGDFGRVYVRRTLTGRGHRLALLVCVAPTTLDVACAPLAPAGLWTIKVAYDGEPVDTTFFIQSDQSAVRGSKSGRRSYFDHSKYRTHLVNGAQADTFSLDHDRGPVDDNDYWPTTGPVQRKGTHNALSSISLPEMVAVGGFDDSSGFPAIYSSSTDGEGSRNAGREILSVSYPSENAPSLFGLIASGARDGSVTAYRGTSMATALATREAALAFLASTGSGQRLGTEAWFWKRAERQEDLARDRRLSDHWTQYLGWPGLRKLKSGVGRIPAPQNDRKWHRLGGQ